MSYSIQGTPYFNQKVSLSKISQTRPVLQFVERVENGQEYRYHISWEDEIFQTNEHNSNKQNSTKQKRRRIFDKFESKQEQKL